MEGKELVRDEVRIRPVRHSQLISRHKFGLQVFYSLVKVESLQKPAHEAKLGDLDWPHQQKLRPRFRHILQHRLAFGQLPLHEILNRYFGRSVLHVKLAAGVHHKHGHEALPHRSLAVPLALLLNQELTR